MVLDFSDEFGIIWEDKVDSGTFSTESTSSTNSMNVVLLSVWQLVVDNETNLLNIDTSSKEISCDQDSSGTSSELLHDGISCLLLHLTMHGRHCKVVVIHGFLKVQHSLFGVAINQSLIDIKVGIEIE